MKKRLYVTLVLLLLTLSLICTATFSANGQKQSVMAESYTFVVSNFEELKSAMAQATLSKEITAILANDVVIESDLTAKGKVTIKANGGEKLIFEKGDTKTNIGFSKNAVLTLDGVTIERTVVAETEKFLFATYEKGIVLTFNDCIFNVATAEIASVSYDRIVYTSTADYLTCYLNNCVFNTLGYFYRGTYVIYNCENLPQKAGSAVFEDFSALKIDYASGKLTFPADITVSEDEDFTQTVRTGASIKSQFTYYVLRNGFSFSFTTRSLKYETPTSASVGIDYASESITFGEEYSVYKDEGLTQELVSGEQIYPGQKLYVVRKGSGIFIQSDTFVLELPLRPAKKQLKADFVCSFGFAMEYFSGMEYRVNGGEWQPAPVFVGLNALTGYTVDMRIASTQNSFVSEIHTVSVTTTE